MTPTQKTYETLQEAYNHFNAELFGDTLPPCVITLSGELKKAYGYYRDQPFYAGKMKYDEIALNPFTSFHRDDRETYSTLVHEMVHLWQFRKTKKKTKTPHDKEWADKMESVGLMPSSTGQPGGKRTGKRVSHYIIDGGPFDLAMRKFKKKIPFKATALPERKKVGSRRTKYTCPECDLNAYGKPGILIICGECNQTMES